MDEQRVQEQTVQTFAYGLFIDVPHKDMVVSTAVILLVFPLAWTTGLRTDADDDDVGPHLILVYLGINRHPSVTVDPLVAFSCVCVCFYWWLCLCTG